MLATKASDVVMEQVCLQISPRLSGAHQPVPAPCSNWSVITFNYPTLTDLVSHTPPTATTHPKHAPTQTHLGALYPHHDHSDPTEIPTIETPSLLQHQIILRLHPMINNMTKMMLTTLTTTPHPKTPTIPANASKTSAGMLSQLRTCHHLSPSL